MASVVGVLCVLLLCFTIYVDAHGWMSNPSPRGQFKVPKRQPYQEEAPTENNSPNDPDFICRGDPAMPADAWPTYAAGSTIDISFTWVARHPGGCFLYLTYDADKPYSEMKWFKFWEQKSCANADGYQVTIPSYLPSATHAILRWEWYGLHRMDQGTGFVEYYAQCVDVKVNGKTNGKLPLPQVNIPGHLPVLDRTNYWDPYNNPNEFLTGPPVATENGSPATQAPVTPKPTPKPSNNGATVSTAAGGAASTNGAASGATTGPCTAGAKNCPCGAGGACVAGLSCSSGVCRDPSDPNPPPSTTNTPAGAATTGTQTTPTTNTQTPTTNTQTNPATSSPSSTSTPTTEDQSKIKSSAVSVVACVALLVGCVVATIL